MTNLEKLELENQALKNVIACIREELDEMENREFIITLGRVSGIINYSDEMVRLALSTGYVTDYREHKEKEPGDRDRTGSGN